MNRRQLKKEVITVLQHSSPQECIAKLSGYDHHRLLNPLFIALCHPIEKVKWHAVCTFGWMVPKIAQDKLETGRIIMRRFLWSLNDESGGIGWGAPEAMAEIMCQSSILREEYLHMLISYMREDGEKLFEDGNFLELPMLQRGLLWGVGRLCQEHLEEMKERRIVEDLTAYLDSTDRYVRGLAVWCLAQLLPDVANEKILKYRISSEIFTLFLNNQLQQISLAALSRNTIPGSRNSYSQS